MTEEANGCELAFSIDLELDVHHGGLSKHRQLGRVTNLLINLFSSHGLTATWSVADPAVSAATDGILHSSPKNEIAILADDNWAGALVPRSRFSRELTRRVESARQHGLSISTLALRAMPKVEHLDVLAGHRLTLLRPAIPPVLPKRSAQALISIRYGLWQCHATCAFPSGRRWWGANGLKKCRSAIERGSQDNQLIHIAIDAGALIEAGSSGERHLAQLLSEVANRRENQSLQVMTLNELTQLRIQSHQSSPAHSILRPAAA